MATRTVCITGGTRGIGKAIASRFAQPGTTLILTYLVDQDAARAIYEELRGHCDGVEIVQADMADTEELDQRLIQPLASAGAHLDVLVNNAAMGVFRPLDALSAKHWDVTQNACVRGPWFLTTRLAPLMAGGAVVNVSSLGSGRVVPYYGAVGVAKAALECLTRYLAVELGPLGIRVNGVAGGTVATSALDTHLNP